MPRGEIIVPPEQVETYERLPSNHEMLDMYKKYIDNPDSRGLETGHCLTPPMKLMKKQ